MSVANDDPNIKGYECKHVCYTTANDGSMHDLLAVKEMIHFTDGRPPQPNLRLIPDFKRPFWITMEMHRNHKDKKEWEDLRKLQKFSSTQVGLAHAISRALGQIPNKYMNLRQVCQSPYVYGADVTSATLVKHYYQEKWPQVNDANGTPYVVCNLDTETDVVKGTGEVIMSSLAQGPKVHLRVAKEFLAGIIDPIPKIHAAFDFYLGEYKAKRKIELTVEIFDGEGEVVFQTMKGLHEWKPDWVAIWNLDFDVNKVDQALQKAGYNVGDVFADPSVPGPFRNFIYHKGATQKVTQSGKTMPLPASDQWHTVETPATFQFLDAMCLYRKLRIAKGMEPNYSLDGVLDRNLGIRKLKFKEADHLVPSSLQWHAFMQTHFKIEYCIYNAFDTISMQELDDKTGDLARQIGLHIGHSEISKFPSQPRRTWDDMHFECLSVGKAAATTGREMRTELDEKVVDLKGWIVTLPAHLTDDTGMKVVREIPDFSTLIWTHVADLDVEGTYPNVQVLCNISKETTVCELCAIEGVDERTQRSIGINLTGGHVNAVEICTRVFKAPTFDQLYADWMADHGQQVDPAHELDWVDEGSGDVDDEEESEEDDD